MKRSMIFWVMSGVLVIGLIVAGCGTTGSGKATSQTRKVGAFSEIEVHGALRVNAVAGGSPSVAISGDDNIVPLVETRVVGDKLVVQATESIRPDVPLVVTVSAKDLTRVTLHGASRATIEGIDNDAFTLEAHGASSATVAGETKRFVAELHGASDANAKKLDAARVTVDAHGASSVDVQEPEELIASLHGASQVTYAGDPKIEQDVHGASRVTRR